MEAFDFKNRMNQGDIQMNKRWWVITATAALIAAASAQTMAQSDRAVVSRSGHRYVRHDGGVTMGMAAGKDQLKANLSRILLRVDPAWTADAVTAAGLPAPKGSSNRIISDYLTIDVPDGVDPLEYLLAIEKVRGVRWARFEIYGIYYYTPNDPYFSQQWGLPLIHLQQAWDHTLGSSSIKVGIIDSPIDVSHPDLPGITRVGGQASPTHYHGTGVAGILSARTNNGTGMAGVAGGVTLYNYGLPTNAAGQGTWGETDVVTAIQQMVLAGVRVINMSIGYGNGDPAFFPTTVAAIDDAVDNHNVVFVCASGNNESKTCDFPASYSKTIAVSAVMSDGIAHGQSGPIDVIAPGWLSILTTDVLGCTEIIPEVLWTGGFDEGDYMCVEDDPNCDSCNSPPCPNCFGGTSAAAPIVTGVASLILSVNPSLTWSEVRDILRWTADKLPGMNGNEWTKEYGYGRVNADAAVLSALAVPGSGTISANTTWSGKIVVGRDIMVNQGVTLTLSAGTQVFFSLTDALDKEPGYTDRVELHIKGALVGSGLSTSRIQLRSATRTPGDGDWVHIQALGQGAIGLYYTDVSNAEWGIYSTSSGSVTLDHSTMTQTRSAGLRLLNGGDGGVLYTTINVTNGDAIREFGGDFLFEFNTLTSGGSGTGIHIEGNNISGSVRECSISGFSRGVALIGGSGVIRDNTITSCGDGVYIEKGNYLIGTLDNGGNEIASCTNGIMAICTSNGTCPNNCGLVATVRKNNIHNNAVGVKTRKTIQVDLGHAGDPGNNIITANSQYCIWNVSTSCGNLPAQGNYYGACNPVPPMCFNGPVDWSNPLCTPPSLMTFELPPSKAVPERTAIVGIHPNPFNPTTTVTFDLKASSAVEIGIYNAGGQLVRRASMATAAAGRNSWTWDGRDQRGTGVSSGIYFVVLKAGNIVDRRKAVLLK